MEVPAASIPPSDVRADISKNAGPTEQNSLRLKIARDPREAKGTAGFSDGVVYTFSSLSERFFQLLADPTGPTPGHFRFQKAQKCTPPW